MAATGSLIPASIDMHCVSGADFGASVFLYTDVAQTTAFDLTGYTVTLVIGNGLLTLTAGGGGLNVTAASGQINVTLTAVQTAALPGNQSYYVKLVDGSGTISIPLHGTLSVATP